MQRTTLIKILYGLSKIFGGVAILCGLVFLFSPKQGIAVVMALSLIGFLGAVVLSLLFGIAGFITSKLQR
ncbi:MAG: hypothetical protein R3C11_24960 [Planctomycetaceae bacterium]